MTRILFASTAMAVYLTGLPAAAQEPVGLEEIVVTAERREESLQRTPLAITAIQGDEVERAVNRAENISTLVPSVNLSPTGGQTQIYIRGVGNLGANSLADAAVAFNVDQVFVGRQTALDGVFYDLERVEVLKGPQGTLYGRNATGGAINVITRKPTLGEFGGSISVDVGNYDLIKASGAANVPLGETLALRAAFQTVSHDGYLSDGYNDQDTAALRAHLFWEPNANFSALLSADYVHVGGKGDVPVPAFRTCGDFCGPSEPANRAITRVNRSNPAFQNFLIAPNDDGAGFHDDRYWSVTGNVNWDLGWGTLTAIPAYRTSKVDSLIYPNLFRGRIRDSAEQASFEARLSSAHEGPLKWVVGAFLYSEDVDSNFEYSHGAGVSTQVIRAASTNETKAVFAQGTWSFTEALRLTVGARHTQDAKSISGAQRCFSGILCQAPLGSGLPGTGFTIRGNEGWTSTDYRVAAEWDVAPQSMLYASVSSGFKSGGFFPAAINNSYLPEDITAYAVGMKNRFFDNRVQLNVEAFYWDYKNHQESHPGFACVNAVGATCVTFGNVFVTENVGAAEIKGMDLDASWLVTEHDRVNFSLGYLDATASTFRYLNPPAAPPNPLIACRTRDLRPAQPFFSIDCSGNRMPRSPEWSGRFGYEHTFPMASGARIVVGASIYFSDGYWGSIDYVPGTWQDSYTKSDANLTYYAPDDDWSVGAWVDNIEDEPVFGGAGVKTYSDPAVPTVTLRAPRTFGVRVNARFGGV